MNVQLFKQQLKKFHEITLIGPLLSHYKSPISTPLIFVDGGLHFKTELHFDPNLPHLSLGDGDSLEEFHGKKEELDILLPTQKDQTDLLYALNVIEAHIHNIFLIGFTGGRLDHQLSVLGETHHFLKMNPSSHLTIDQKIYASGKNKELNISGQFSILALEKISIQITGQCQYQLEEMTPLLPLSGRGISNHGTGLVSIAATGPFFIFLK